MKSINVFRFDYVMDKSKNWTAYIAAYSHEEAQRYLNKTVGDNIRIDSSGTECRLDAVSDELRATIAANTDTSTISKKKTPIKGKK